VRRGGVVSEWTCKCKDGFVPDLGTDEPDVTEPTDGGDETEPKDGGEVEPTDGTEEDEEL